MAIAYDQTINLRIAAETTGSSEVEKLAVEIETLGKQGATAAPRFLELANEVRNLGQQQIRITGLETAITSAKQTWTAVSEARREVQSLDKALADTKGAGANRDAIKLLEAALRTANRELSSAEKAWGRQKDALSTARAAAADAGVDTKALASEQVRLAAALDSASKSLTEQKAAFSAQQAAAQAAATEEARLAQIIETSKTRQKMAAQELLAAEKKAYAESEQAIARSIAKRAEEAAAVEAYSARSKKALADAFSGTGTRSSATIQAEILKINQGLITLAANAKVSGADFDRAFTQAQARISSLRAEMNGGVDPFTTSVNNSSTALSGFTSRLAPIAGAIAAAFGAQQVAKAAADFDSLVRSMGAIQGQGAKAAAEVGYITDAAQRLGLNLQTTAKAYTSWLASIKGTALEGEAGRKVFEAVAGSMSKLGKSAADTEGAMLALGQMVSKGTVSMEELRGQLAERLPGALQAAADGAGLTTAQLIKMVESGSVLAEDLLPGMAAQLQKLYGSQPVGGFVASWNQMTGAVTEAIGRIGQTDAVMAAVGVTFGAVKETVLVLGTGILTVSEGFGLLGKTIGATAGAIASGNWSGLREEISKMASESAERINALASKTAIATGVQQAFGQAITSAGAAAEAASPKYLLIQSAYTEVTKAAAKYTDLVEKSLESRKAEQDLAVGLAAEFGTEAEQRQAAARAASVQADALGIVALAKDAEAKITLSQIAATQAEADAVVAAGGKISQAKTDEIIKLKESSKLKVEEAARSLAAAEAANVHAAAVRADTLTYADNSGKVNELREAWKLASAAAETLRASLAAGIASKEQSAQADIAAGAAAKLYRDATADAVIAIQARAAVQRAAISIEEKGRSLQLAQIETQIAVAKARGRDLEVAKLQFEYGRVEMELSALKGKALRAEAEAQLALVAAKRAELEASGQMTEVKRLELKAAEQAAKAKMIDAQIADELASRARQLKDVVRGTSDAMDDATESTDKLGDSWSTAADKADRYSSSANRAAKAGKSTDGTMNPDGTINRTVFTSTSDNYTRGIDLGLTSDQAKVFATALSDEITRANAAARGKAQETAGVAFGVNDYVAYQQQAEQKALEYARNNTTSSTVSNAEKSVGNNFYGSSARTININLNGKSTSIRVANQTDADALVGTLQELAARS